MKKVFVLFLALIMTLGLAACAESDTSSKNNPAIISYMEENGTTLMRTMEESFASTAEMTCTSRWEVEGNGLVLFICINELEDLPQETKNQMQDAYDSMAATFDSVLLSIQKDIPEVEYCVLNVCEKDGDSIAVIRMD